MKESIHWLTAGAIRSRYESKVLSPTIVVAHLLRRIAALDARYHAFIQVDAATALQAAHQAEQEMEAGIHRGPLHGIPVALKDNIDVAAQRTSCHSQLRLDHVASRDASVVHALKRGGAILMGKLALHEFAITGPSFDLPFPPARNPWNIRHHPGGSSSGSAAALAAGLVPLTVGTDTAGSIRHPAAATGVLGLKPTYGLIPMDGVFPCSPTLDHLGPMARNVEDLALLLDVLAKPRSTAPAGYARDLRKGVQRMRIGYVSHFHSADMSANPEVASALDLAADVFRQAGALVEEAVLAPLGGFTAPVQAILKKEAYDIHAKSLHESPGGYSTAVRGMLMEGAGIEDAAYREALKNRRHLGDVVDRALMQADVLLCASSMDPACRIDAPTEIARTFPRQARSPFNLTGHPALSMMCGLSSEGLPLSMQLVARRHDEGTLLRAAAAFEAATGWHRMRPFIP